MLRGAVEGPHRAVWDESELDDDSPDDTCWTEGYSGESSPSDEEPCPSEPESARGAKWRRTIDWHQQNTLGGFFPDGSSAFADPGLLGALPSSCARNPASITFPSAAASRSLLTEAGRDRSDLPYCTVPPTYRTARTCAYPSRPADARSAPRQASPCSLGTSFSNRTVSHPSFYPYYTAVSRWGGLAGAGGQGPLEQSKVCAGQASDDGRHESVLPINTCDFFYTDPLMPPGHRVYNCLSNNSQQVFQNFRLNTPPPVMSVCPPLPAASVQAVPMEDSFPASTVSQQNDSRRAKTWTKWLSLAEHDALRALLDMPYQDTSPPAESVPVRESTCPMPGCRVPHSFSGTESSQPEIGQGTLEASAADSWTPSRMNPSAVDTQLLFQDGNTPDFDLSSAWKRGEGSSQDVEDTDIPASKVHCDSQAAPRKLELRLESSNSGEFQKVHFPPYQHGVNLWGLKDSTCVAPPVYQLLLRSPKTEESCEGLKDTGTTAMVGNLVPLPAVVSGPTHCSLQESDAVSALLELRSLGALEEEGPRSSVGLICAMPPAQVVESWNCADDVMGSEEGDMEDLDQSDVMASHVHSDVMVEAGNLVIGLGGGVMANQGNLLLGLEDQGDMLMNLNRIMVVQSTIG